MFNILLCCISWNEISFQSRKKRTLSTFTHLRSFWQKWNKLGKPMRERMESCYTSSSIFPIEPNRFPSLWMQNKKWCMLSNNHNESICWHHIFLLEAWGQRDLFSVEFTIGWVVVAILKCRLKEFTVLVMHSNAILILKTDIWQACMKIHPHKMMTSSLVHDALFIRYFYVLWVFEFVALRFDLSQNQNLTT